MNSSTCSLFISSFASTVCRYAVIIYTGQRVVMLCVANLLLHWLPIRKRIVYKLVVTVYKCLHGLAPPYLAVDCVPVTSLPSRRHLRSAESGCLAITGARTTLGSRNFAVDGARIWNSLPVDLRLLSQSLRTFGHNLKHYLFVDEP